ncbi:hypothetical protein [Ancylobacter rudongensis]|uniref:MazG nucleotide pyrophosphohydrolase domain-containing protein n=1 Tax=Ancylobacter rudongensis TaxID=177413 RepID=A0A1G4UQG7_9HYPH|nr:hypothetical protein [Ancylobacter rudongensis]SCW95870.1 hypothetical protein SAMN05660859_0137 [Ancylobacter rudongensis]
MAEPINSTISPWMPEQDRVRLAVLGKLAEEAGELASRAARCIIQGIDETDPDTGRSNADELGREIADVMACAAALEALLRVNYSKQRVTDKVSGFARWHCMIRERDANG